MMNKSLFGVIKRCMSSANEPAKRFIRNKPFDDFTKKGHDQLKQKEQTIVNTSYKAGFTAEDLEPFNDMVKKALKLTNATPYEITQFKVAAAIEKFKVSTRDTGSAAIQVAVRTERLLKQIKHCQDNRQDKYAGRALQLLLQDRRRWLDYLRFTDYHRYVWICSEFCIPDQPPRNGHHKEHFRLRPNVQVKTI